MFTTTQEIKNDNLSFVVIGESGAGKTYLLKTLPDLSRVLIVNAENGLLSLNKFNIDVYDITVDRDGNPMREDLRFEKLNHLLKLLATDEYKKKYDWIAFDSLTEIAQNLVYFLQKQFPDRKDSLVLWSEYTRLLQELLKGIRDFKPYNTILLALDSVEKDADSNRYIGINVNGKALAPKIPALFDEVFYLKQYEEDRVTKRILITSKYNNITAKDRSGNLEQFEAANLTTIINKIKGE